MNSVDDSYYIISNDGYKLDGVTDAVGDEETKELKYGSHYLQPSRPMFFYNPEKSDWLRKGIKEKI